MIALNVPLALGALLVGALLQEAPGAAAPPVQEPVQEVITVTAVRLPTPDAVSSTPLVVVDAATLQQRPAQGLDEVLRWIPQFSLFRRSPARAAHPTTQGVTLRGVAPSATSRALVLLDGVPLTDAFGGWVDWNRVPLIALERVEVALGGASSTWGNQALSGVLQLATRATPGAGDLRARLRGGSLGSAEVAAAYGNALEGVGLLAAVQGYRTDGYVAVAPQEAGPIDEPVDLAYLTGLLRLDLDDGLRLLLQGGGERRDNGTAEQHNETAGGGGGLRWQRGGPANGWQATLFGRRQVFRSRFSAVAADRASERPTLDQRVPSTDLGGSLIGWRTPAGGDLGAGLDLRHVAGVSEETSLITGVTRTPGGRQSTAGLFVGGGTQPVGDLRLEASLRGDGWRNVDRADGAGRDKGTVSPRLGTSWLAAPGLRLWASAQQSFRSPTLNELYRSFRVGDAITLANPELTHERLRGVEAGAEFAGGAGGPWLLRLGVSRAYLRDAVINAAIDGSGNLRQRRNLGGARVDGVEFEARARRGAWQLQGAVSWMRATVEASDDAALLGNWLPQVPTYRWSAALGHRGGSGWHALVGALGTGPQFEDDRNQRRLGAGVTVDASFGVPLGDRLGIELQAQNLFDRRLQVGKTPVTLLGPPRTLMLGVAIGPSRVGVGG